MDRLAMSFSFILLIFLGYQVYHKSLEILPLDSITPFSQLQNVKNRCKNACLNPSKIYPKCLRSDQVGKIFIASEGILHIFQP